MAIVEIDPNEPLDGEDLSDVALDKSMPQPRSARWGTHTRRGSVVGPDLDLSSVPYAMDKQIALRQAYGYQPWNPYVGTFFGGAPVPAAEMQDIANVNPAAQAAGRQVRRFALGAGLPLAGAAVAAPTVLGQAAGLGLGSLAAEGIDYAASLPEERPGWGGIVRPAINAAFGAGGTYLASKFAPAYGPGGAAISEPQAPTAYPYRVPPPEPAAPTSYLYRVPEVAPVPSAEVLPAVAPSARLAPEISLPEPPIPRPAPAKVGREVPVAVGQSIRNTVQKQLRTITPERQAKAAFIKKVSKQQMDGDLELFSVKPLIDRLKGYFGPPERAIADDAKRLVRDKFTRLADDLENEVGAVGGTTLDRVDDLLAELGTQGFPDVADPKLLLRASDEARQAYRVIRKEFHGQMQKMIETEFGAEEAAQMASRNAKISQYLDSAEDVAAEISKRPEGFVNRALIDKELITKIDRMDQVHGTTLRQSVEEYRGLLANVERLRKEIPAANQAAAKDYEDSVAGLKLTHKESADAVNKFNRLTARGIEAEHRAAMEAYKEAVAAADKAKRKAILRARIVASAIGGTTGYFLGVPGVDFPGEQYAGAVAGAALGPLASGLAARTIVGGSRAVAGATPRALAVERYLEEKNP